MRNSCLLKPIFTSRVGRPNHAHTAQFLLPLLRKPDSTLPTHTYIARKHEHEHRNTRIQSTITRQSPKPSVKNANRQGKTGRENCNLATCRSIRSKEIKIYVRRSGEVAVQAPCLSPLACRLSPQLPRSSSLSFSSPSHPLLANTRCSMPPRRHF